MFSKQKENMDETMIKTEPDEVLVMPEEIEVKLNPQEVNPIALIDEEQFDSLSDRPTTKSSKRINNINTKSSSQVTVSTCGRIDLEASESSTNYKLTCNECDTKIPIEKWKLFVEHIESNHKSRKGEEEEEEDELQCKSEHTDEEEGLFENADSGTQDSFKDDNMSSDGSDNDNYEPKQKINKKDKSYKGVSFGRTDKDKVLYLLELLKSHAILWHRRQSVKNRFDEALIEVTKDFNTKYPEFQLTEEQMRLSITRIKYQYQRVTDPRHKRHINDSTFKEKFSDYFQLCADIESKSKTVEAKCKICGVSFLEEVDLQVHAFQMHNIGELPFKCKRCGRGFSRASTLTSHEKKHSDMTYNCEYCPRTFDQEDKLHAHLRMHTGTKHICEICGKQFENAYRYKRHKLHHEPPKEKCEICGKMLYEKYTLSEHMKSHQNERQYMCGICNKTFNRQNGLALHKRSVHKIATQYVWASK